jgi:hypothetical protein
MPKQIITNFGTFELHAALFDLPVCHALSNLLTVTVNFVA